MYLRMVLRGRLNVPTYTTSDNTINFSFTSYNNETTYFYFLGTAPKLRDVLDFEARSFQAH